MEVKTLKGKGFGGGEVEVILEGDEEWPHSHLVIEIDGVRVGYFHMSSFHTDHKLYKLTFYSDLPREDVLVQRLR